MKSVIIVLYSVEAVQHYFYMEVFMKAIKVVKLQRIIIIGLLIFFAVVFIWEQKIFNDQIDTIDSYEELVEKQRNDNDEVIQMWKDSYNALESKYADKIRECHELSQTGVEIPKYSYSYDEVILLAKVVQCEAGTYSEAPESQKMVCQVILKRVAAEDFPNTITEVLEQNKQFSVMSNGSVEKCELEVETLNNVYEVLLYGTNMPSNVKYFYASYLESGWITTLPVYDKVQGTTFAYEN